MWRIYMYQRKNLKVVDCYWYLLLNFSAYILDFLIAFENASLIDDCEIIKGKQS